MCLGGRTVAGEVFNGKFQKTTEAFVVQRLDPVELNRFSFDMFFWLAAAVVVGLAIHFVLQALPDLMRREKAP